MAKVEDFFHEKKTGELVFTGDKLLIDVPRRFEKIGWLNITDKVKMIGICTFNINDKYIKGYRLHAMITSYPSNNTIVNIDGDQYQQLHYKKGDIFIESSSIVQEQSIAYHVLNEFVSLGKIPKWMTENNSYKLFLDISKTTGVNFFANQIAFEYMLAHLWRNPDDINQPAHEMENDKKAVFVGMKNTAVSALTTSGKIIGSNTDVGMEAALVNPSYISSDLDDILRD
ncbi:MAG: hypothetical protein GY804_09430 [Alphaproteobacteria bacterium]|nr:hypothetical protein [Alphaproteobacteria bacterium]